MQEVLRVGRALAATAGRPLLLRGVALGCGVGIAGAVVFGGNGARPADVVALFDHSVAARSILEGVWALLATSAIAPAFLAPGTRTLRSLGLPRRPLLLALVALLAAVQLPWTLLFLVGAGPLRAVAATASAIAIEASAVAVAQRARGAFALFTASMLFVLVAPPTPIAIVAAPIVAVMATAAAWRGARIVDASGQLVRRAAPSVALASAYVAHTVRAAAARVHAAATASLTGGAMLALSLRNEPEGDAIRRALVVLAVPFTVACATLAGPVVDLELRLAPWLRSTRTRAPTLALAIVLAVATPSSAFAASAGAIAVTTAHAPSTVVGAAIGWSSAIGCVVALWARHARGARRPSTFVVGVVAIAAASTVMAATC